MSTDWSARQYLKFEDERTRPARDLLAQIPLDSPCKVFDLGCGPGNSTGLLVNRFPQAQVIGVDSSADMLRKARERLPGCGFIEADLNDWVAPGDADLLYSNATFQWLRDHLSVLKRLLDGLQPGAVLAVQMPNNFDEPVHVLMRETARSGPWAKVVGSARAERSGLPQAGDYYDALKPHCSRLDMWHTIYEHPLDGAEALVEWVKGTGLRPYIDPLPPEQREAFLRNYTDGIARAYPPRFDGKVLLRFPRLFMVAVR